MIDTPIIWSWFLGLCGAVITINAVIQIIVNAVHKSKEPNKAQNERLDALEARFDSYDICRSVHERELKSIEKGNSVVQIAILYLIRHDIDGNYIEELKKAEQDLTTYLTEKGEIQK